MKYLPFISLISLLLSGTACAQTTAINPGSVPDELRICLRSFPDLELDGAVNPFYLSGNFDGDGITDFVVQVISKSAKQQGVIFCLSSGPKAIWGAGKPNSSLKTGQKWPFDSWMLIRRGSKHLSVYPNIKFDAVALMIADEGGGLVYWNGNQLLWQREE